MKKAFYWLLAIIITFTAVIYQRKTGPTYNQKFEIEVNGQQYQLSLIRSMEIGSGSLIKLGISDTSIKARLHYKKYPTTEPFQVVDFEYSQKPIHSFVMNKVFGVNEETGWFASVPDQAAAGKIEYYFDISDKQGTSTYLKDQPVVVRFKGRVPPSVLVPHIFFMFFAMLLGNLAGIMAVFKHERFRFYTILTLLALFAGGLVLGPWVQWYAFGEAWAGIPFAWDLTDNKTLLAFIFWLLAFFMNRKKARPVYTIVASIVMLIIYSIPHSMFGSQLDPETGEIIQGWIKLFIF
jgi:diacylglycerol kinase